MKVIYNNIIPFRGFKAINLFTLVFVRKGLKMSKVELNHENIHSYQMREMLYIFFYIWYIVEWLIKLFKYKFDNNKAYKNISFEKEAYANELNLNYVNKRERYCWLKFL